MAEALYFHRLIVSTRDGNSQAAQHRNGAGTGRHLRSSIPAELVARASRPGIANPGQYFHVKRPNQVGFLIEFVEQWKELGASEQTRLLDRPVGVQGLRDWGGSSAVRR